MANKRKCGWCGDYGLGGIVVNMKYFCGYEAAISYGKKNAPKAKAKARKIESAANRKAVLELNRRDLKWQHKRTQIVFNYLRVTEELKWFEDMGIAPTCISCQKELGDDQWCCGHYKTVGSNGRLRYDKANTYLQHNRNCNMAKSGDIEGYKRGLLLRFSDGQEIIDYCESNNLPIKRTWQELEEIRTGFAAELKAIEKSRDE